MDAPDPFDLRDVRTTSERRGKVHVVTAIHLPTGLRAEAQDPRKYRATLDAMKDLASKVRQWAD
jgi:hypothetical protein